MNSAGLRDFGLRAVEWLGGRCGAGVRARLDDGCGSGFTGALTVDDDTRRMKKIAAAHRHRIVERENQTVSLDNKAKMMHTCSMLKDDLQRAIRADGRSLHELSAASGVAVAILSRFTRDLRDVTTTTAGRLCDALALELRPKARRKAVR